uniref:BHLH domain-containing protein n=1 Tax=Panagrellus redivivus TaxID=6233 RepID=A0A7E4VAU0_PANRE
MSVTGLKLGSVKPLDPGLFSAANISAGMFVKMDMFDEVPRNQSFTPPPARRQSLRHAHRHRPINRESECPAEVRQAKHIRTAETLRRTLRKVEGHRKADFR